MKRKTIFFIQSKLYLLISILSLINVTGIENRKGRVLELILGFLFFIIHALIQYKYYNFNK